jgi:hypothetical protein
MGLMVIAKAAFFTFAGPPDIYPKHVLYTDANGFRVVNATCFLAATRHGMNSL